jgi:hypothetical protein
MSDPTDDNDSRVGCLLIGPELSSPELFPDKETLASLCTVAAARWEMRLIAGGAGMAEALFAGDGVPPVRWEGL